METTKALAVNKVGRPSVISETTVAKLCIAFKIGLDVQTACLHAGINRSTFYRNYEKDENFATQIDNSRVYLLVKAQLVIFDEIVNKNNWHLAWKYAERRNPELRPVKLCSICGNALNRRKKIEYNNKSPYLDTILY